MSSDAQQMRHLDEAQTALWTRALTGEPGIDLNPRVS